MRENGEQALIEARRLQENLAGQSQNLQVQWSELRERETRIASVSYKIVLHIIGYGYGCTLLITLSSGATVISPAKTRSTTFKNGLEINSHT